MFTPLKPNCCLQHVVGVPCPDWLSITISACAPISRLLCTAPGMHKSICMPIHPIHPEPSRWHRWHRCIPILLILTHRHVFLQGACAKQEPRSGPLLRNESPQARSRCRGGEVTGRQRAATPVGLGRREPPGQTWAELTRDDPFKVPAQARIQEQVHDEHDEDQPDGVGILPQIIPTQLRSCMQRSSQSRSTSHADDSSAC